MKNLNVSEKSKGVILFAFNTKIDYVSIAEKSARLINKFLKLPVTLITNQDTQSKYFDQVINVENDFENYRIGIDTGSIWKNGDRYRAYELSPYDHTLLLDSDYLILDNNLLKILDTCQDYVVMKTNRSPREKMNIKLGEMSIDGVWATVVAFNKTPKAKCLFGLVGRVQRNYNYYRLLYKISHRNFRNDHAFAIADNILNGYKPSPGIPWSMMTLDNPIQQITVDGQRLVIREQEQAWVVPQQDLHVMDKQYLISENFQQLVDELCPE